MAEDKSNKTEQPTAKRRNEARKKGQVAKSMELNSVAVMMAGLLILVLTSTLLYGQLTDVMASMLSQAGQVQINNKDFSIFIAARIQQLMIILTPVMIAVFFTALLANIFQVGAMFSLETIAIKLSKLDPIKGMSKIFSVKSLMELFKSIAKIVIITATAYIIITSKMETILGLGQLEPYEIGGFAIKVSFEIFIKTLWLMVVLVVIDYAFQKWQHEQELKMSKDEVKEEHKQTEGDPHVKNRIRTIQRETARKRMMAAVPDADVVVTNPTHLAIALKYDQEASEAPTVLAKGQDLVARKIKEIAEENDIPLVENKPLAQGLYKSVEIGETIPYEFYQAVADVLAYVYQAKGKVING